MRLDWKRNIFIYRKLDNFYTKLTNGVGNLGIIRTHYNRSYSFEGKIWGFNKSFHGGSYFLFSADSARERVAQASDFYEL